MKFLTNIFIFVFTVNFSTKATAQEFTPEDLIIDAIECAGNERTECEIIKNEIYLSPGDRLNEEEIKNAKIRLQLLNLFKSVNLNLAKGDLRGHVVLNVEVVEDSPVFSETSIRTGPLGRSNSYGDLSWQVGHRNLFGKGKILQATISPNEFLKINDSPFMGTLEYIDPHLFGHKKYFFNARIDRTVFKQKNNQDSYTVADQSTQTEINVGRRVFDFSYLSIGTSKNYYQYSYRTDLYETEFKKNTLENDSWNVTYGWNSEDDSYFTTEGSVFSFSYYKTDYPYQSKNYLLFSKFYKTVALNQKNFIQFGLNERYDADRSSNIINFNLQWAYQLRRGEFGKPITDARFSITPLLANYRDANGITHEEKGVDLSLLMDTNSFGIVKLSTFFWGL